VVIESNTDLGALVRPRASGEPVTMGLQTRRYEYEISIDTWNVFVADADVVCRRRLFQSWWMVFLAWWSSGTPHHRRDIVSSVEKKRLETQRKIDRSSRKRRNDN
jgi:hypothetical protein